MNSLRKWFYRPRKDDHSLMAQFYFADEELNLVAAELDSFDGRKDPERCTALVNQLRHCQDRVLNICIEMMDEVIPNERAARDFHVKFPDGVMQENLFGQLWFGAECLAAGSSIMNREAESSQMRPLAKAVTKTIETVRNLLREQCLKPVPEYTEKIRESLKIFDRLFAEFELNYVSAMVPVKSVEEHEAQQSVAVLFSETVQRALKLGLATQDQVDDYDPALMFTIPRLAIVAGLVMFPDGPLNLDREPCSLSELFRPFRTLLTKIRELLWTMTCAELAALEKALCSMDEPDPSAAPLLAADTPPSSAYGRAAFTSDFVQKFYANHPSCRMVPPELGSFGAPSKKSHDHRKRERTGKSRSSRTRARQERQSERFLARLAASGEDRPRARRRSRRHHHPRPHQPRHSHRTPLHDSDSGDEARHRPARIPPPPPLPHSQDHARSHHPRSQQPMTRIKTIACSCGSLPPEAAQTSFLPSSGNSAQSHGDTATTCDTPCDSNPVPGPEARCPCPSSEPGDATLEAGTLVQATAQLCLAEDEEHERPGMSEGPSPVPEASVSSKDISHCKYSEEAKQAQEESCENAGGYDSKGLKEETPGTPQRPPDPNTPESGRCSSGSTSPYNSGAEDDEEVALALQAAEVAATWRARARFTDTQDLIHRLFVCISGVADQLQTNYASDLRKILKCVFLINQSPPEEPPPPPKSLHCPEEDEEDEEERHNWSASSPVHSYGEEEEGTEGHSLEGNDSERLSVESAEDALVVIGSPEHHHTATTTTNSHSSPSDHYRHHHHPEEYSPHSSPPLSPSSSLSLIPPPIPPLPPPPPPPLPPHSSMDIAGETGTTPPSPSISSFSHPQYYSHHHHHHHHLLSHLPPPTSPTDIPSFSANPEAMMSQAASPPLACPPSVQVPAAIFNDHALMQFSEVTQASVPPNVELLSPTQVQYAESFGVIPEPFTSRATQEQQLLGPRDEGTLVGEREAGRRRGPRVQEPPPWVPDQQAPRCMACGASFTMVRRRHHCRNCGKVFCAQCSQHAVPLPHYGIWKAVRVCNVCFLYYVTFTTDSTTTTTSSS